jgi:hypothetical protein
LHHVVANSLVLTVSSLIGKVTVEIKVSTGPISSGFTVHKDVLCKKVVFFDKMFNGSFLEGSAEKAHLPEDDPIAFKLLISWIYLNAIPPLQNSVQCGMSEEMQFYNYSLRPKSMISHFWQTKPWMH